MIDRHFHWTFHCYNSPDVVEGEGGKATAIKFGVDVEVLGYLSEADARIAAKDILTRDHYGLRSVRECATCGWQAATIEQQGKMITALKESL